MKPFNHAAAMGSLLDQRRILLDKKLVPDHTRGMFDISNMKKALYDWETDPIKERACPHCGIVVRAPNEWFRHHIKTHYIKEQDKEKIKEGDVFKTNSHVDFV